MAFSSRRGRPPKTAEEKTDLGTAELRLKHALGLTAEPIDLCLNRGLITQSQHWCGLHLRWLYTVRYGAPVTTTRYVTKETQEPITEDNPEWRIEREREYAEARELLTTHRAYEPVMRVCVYNESPAFLNHALQQRAWNSPAMANLLHETQRKFTAGLDLLADHWKR